MFEIVLVEPEIPSNSGNLMRLAANTGCRLHLVRPLGFSLSDKKLARAGMDYRAHSQYVVHDDWNACRVFLGVNRPYYALTTKGSRDYHEILYRPDDVLVFGAETRGLAPHILEAAAARLRVPMQPGSRSLNLSNAAAIVVYEAWRQLAFTGRDAVRR
jgi:tRNA (cytidine/uridine-2'-O-)-methyltransferase